MDGSGRCQSVRAGDVARFTLRIDAVESARAVYSQFQLTMRGHRAKYHQTDLPLLRDGVLSGSAMGTRDAQDHHLYHFSFAVPDVAGGYYRTAGFTVRAQFADEMDSAGVIIGLDRHARSQVNGYCLAVFGAGEHNPVVTEFQPKPAERPAGTNTSITLFH